MELGHSRDFSGHGSGLGFSQIKRIVDTDRIGVGHHNGDQIGLFHRARTFRYLNPDGLFCDYQQSSTTFVAFIECVNKATLGIIQRYSVSRLPFSCYVPLRCLRLRIASQGPPPAHCSIGHNWTRAGIDVTGTSAIHIHRRCQRCRPDSQGLINKPGRRPMSCVNTQPSPPSLCTHPFPVFFIFTAETRTSMRHRISRRRARQ
jgi:hypothetical protein